MTVAYRITKSKYAHDVLSGRGAIIVAGRWHHKSVPIVYCAASLSLAALEAFVHFGTHDKAIAFSSVEISIPDGLVDVLPVATLPANWRAVPAPHSTADLGSEWLKSKRSAVLKVPSALTPGEYNYLINPAHPAFHRISASAPTPYTFDPRLWK